MGVGGNSFFDVRADKRWLTAAEAAAENLPAMPAKRTLQLALSSREIASRRRQGRGGGREFHWTELPREAREEYLKRYGAACEQADESATAKSARKDLKAEARRLIVDAANAFVAERNAGIEKGLKAFSELYARRKCKLDAWVYEIEPAAAPQRLRKWDRKIRTRGTGALIDTRGRKAHSGLFDRDLVLRTYCIAALGARPHLSCPQLRAAIRTDLQRDIPLRTVQAFAGEFRKANSGALKALANPDAHRSHHKPAFGSRSADIVRINQRWEIDATRADVMCLTEDGSRRRFALTQVIDVFTRRAMLLVSDQPRALATQALLRRAIIAWGLCETLKLDNGKEFAARAVLDFCRSLGVALDFSRPFHPEEKPHVERFFKTLNHGFLPLLPGYTGSNIAERKAIEARASFSHRFGEEAQLVIETQLSPAELQARLDCWLREIYERAPHDGLNGKTPFEMAMAFGAEARRITDERALDVLLLPAPETGGIRQVVKKGVRIANRWYVHEDLGPLCALHARVSVRMDPHDLSRVVVYSADTSDFLCVAECADELPPSRMQQIAVAAQSKARRAITAIREDVRKVQRIFPADGLADRILANASREQRDRFPLEGRHANSTPEFAGGGFALAPDAQRAMALASPPRLIEQRKAAEALDASRETIVPPLTEEQVFRADEALAEIHARESAPPVKLVQCDGYTRPALDDDAEQFIWLDDFRKAGNRLDVQDAQLLADYAADETLMQLVNLKRGSK